MGKVKEMIVPNSDASMMERILPKRDYARVIEMDKVYLGKLRNNMDKLIEYLDSNNTRKDTLEYAEKDRQLMELHSKFNEHERLVKDKMFHFKNVFLPIMEKEIKECNEKFKKAYTKAKEVIRKEKTYKDAKMIKLLKSEVKLYDSLPKSVDVEIINEIYKPIKRILSTLDVTIE